MSFEELKKWNNNHLFLIRNLRKNRNYNSNLSCNLNNQNLKTLTSKTIYIYNKIFMNKKPYINLEKNFFWF